MEVRERPCCLCLAAGVDFEDDVCKNCKFAVAFVDERGWEYFVRGGLGTPKQYKGFYRRPGKTGSHGMSNLPWRDTFAQAQEDLNAYAKKKGWTAAEGRTR